MNTRRTIFYLLLTVLGVVLLYNLFIVPLLMQPNHGMGMGMHWRMQNNYYTDLRYIYIFVIIAASIFFLELTIFKKPENRCKQCGTKIEDEGWRICPVCGTPLKKGR